MREARVAGSVRWQMMANDTCCVVLKRQGCIATTKVKLHVCPCAGENGQLALRSLASSTLHTLLPKLETRGQLGAARWRLVRVCALFITSRFN